MLLQRCLQARLGQVEARKAAEVAMAAASAVMQGKRVEILVPPQAAAWLQVFLCILCRNCLARGIAFLSY